jgi:DNA-binding response OmpR family regulator
MPGYDHDGRHALSGDPFPPARRAATMSVRREKRQGVVIGVVEDDPVAAEIVGARLEEGGYAVRHYRSVHEFRRGQGSDSVDLILLDWGLPDGTGIDLLRQLRGDRGVELPVIFLTARDDPGDIVAGLDAGADDYIVKPARSSELLARVRSALRRRGPAATASFEEDTAPFALDVRARTVSWDGKPIPMQGREFELLVYLLRRAGRLVSRASLLTEVWNTNPRVATRSVDTYVSRLRRKLGLAGTSGWELTAVYQHGYRLARVATDAAEASHAAAAPEDAGVATPADD